jgi:hypothetical protein
MGTIDKRNEGISRVRPTSFIPESTERQDILSFLCIVPGNASQKARTRMRASVRALRMMTASAEG